MGIRFRKSTNLHNLVMPWIEFVLCGEDKYQIYSTGEGETCLELIFWWNTYELESDGEALVDCPSIGVDVGMLFPNYYYEY